MVKGVECGVYYRVKGVGFKSIVRVRVQGGVLLNLRVRGLEAVVELRV